MTLWTASTAPAPGPPPQGAPDLREPVYVTYRIPDPGLPMLRNTFKVIVHKGKSKPTPDEMAEAARDCRGMLVLVRDQVDASLMARFPKLKAIANYGVGYDNIDVGEATRLGIMVTNTPDVLTEATADLTWALLLAAARRLGEGERMVRAGGFNGWTPDMLLGADLQGSTLGLVGFGRIARAVARRAVGFRLRLLHSARSDHEEQADAVGSRAVDLERLLVESDFVSLHVPLSLETHHLIDEAALRKMKPTAILVNTSRGPVVDEPALVRALSEGWIAGAGLDVYEREPELTPGLAALENAVLLPHIGSATVGARSAMSRVAATNLTVALSGQRPPHLVNPAVLEGG